MAYAASSQSNRQNSNGATRADLLTDAGALVRFLTGRLTEAGEPGDGSPALDAARALATPMPPRDAGVLLPLHAREGRPYLLFTRRAPMLSSHSGEISFPGGSREATDATLTATALREADEELRIAPERVRVLGHLEPVFTVVSNFLITPVVGWLGDGPIAVTPNPGEVAEVIDAPLDALADPAIFHVERWTRNGRQVPVYFYDLGPHRIWGATGRILHQLLALLPEG